jgi:hypothetical protein
MNEYHLDLKSSGLKRPLGRSLQRRLCGMPLLPCLVVEGTQIVSISGGNPHTLADVVESRCAHILSYCLRNQFLAAPEIEAISFVRVPFLLSTSKSIAPKKFGAQQ